MTKNRICPDCQTRILERYQHYCSECRQDRLEHSIVLARYKYDRKNRLKQNKKQLEYYHRTFKSRDYYRQLAKN